MTPYERGFAAGERAANEDKKRGNPLRMRPEHPREGYEAAWWDGYTPRGLSWALRQRYMACWCESCDMTANAGLRTRMSVCDKCGDKRCQRAGHHSKACDAETKE